jgi:hypothetical protein
VLIRVSLSIVFVLRCDLSVAEHHVAHKKAIVDKALAEHGGHH